MAETRNYYAKAAGAPPSKPSSPSTGYPQTAVPGVTEATVPGAYWYYQVAEELRNGILAGGLTPDFDAVDQIGKVLEKSFGRANNGDPNGALAANRLHERCWNTAPSLPVLYVATTADGTVGGTVWTRMHDLLQPIGQPIVVQDDLTGADVPSNDGDARFIKLTAGEDGAGQYNEGLLTSESVSGSAPLVVATAVIDDPDSPMDGQTVHLINTERRFLRAGSAGTTEDDALQGFAIDRESRGDNDHAGVDATYSPGGGTQNLRTPESDGTNGTPRIDDETRPRNIGATYYMRIR